MSDFFVQSFERVIERSNVGVPGTLSYLREEMDRQECLSYLVAGTEAVANPGLSQNVLRMRRIDFNLLS